MRLFFTIRVREEIIRSVGKGVDRLRETRAAVRWVKPEGIHLTVRFLGETGEDRVDALVGAMSAVCGTFHPFPLRVEGLSAYPDLRRPRVIWAGVREPSGVLVRLGAATEKTVVEMGWKKEKHGFSPHITLGRVKGSINITRLTEVIRSLTDERWGDQEVEDLILFRSRLKPEGAVYEKVHVFPLGKT